MAGSLSVPLIANGQALLHVCVQIGRAVSGALLCRVSLSEAVATAQPGLLSTGTASLHIRQQQPTHQPAKACRLLAAHTPWHKGPAVLKRHFERWAKLNTRMSCASFLVFGSALLQLFPQLRQVLISSECSDQGGVESARHAAAKSIPDVISERLAEFELARLPCCDPRFRSR